jgi:cobalt-zinc-cadmium efflux system protein
VPKTVDEGAVLAYLAALPGVAEGHDLHISALSTTETALTAYLVRPQAGTDDALLRLAGEELRRRFGIGHATFQVEKRDATSSCWLARRCRLQGLEQVAITALKVAPPHGLPGR